MLIWHEEDLEDLKNYIKDFILDNSYAMLKGVRVQGESLSYLTQCVREGYTVSQSNQIAGNDRIYDFADFLEAMGFHLAEGKVGKWTKSGYQYVQPAKIVYIK